MDAIIEVLDLLFGSNNELRQIIWVTLQMSFLSTAISAAIGIPCGVILGCVRFPGHGIIMRITTTLMGLPPVVAGLVVFLILSNKIGRAHV